MKKEGISPRTKDILRLVGAGVILTSVFLAPGTGIAVKAIIDLYREIKREKDWRTWQKYNLPRLRFLLKRLARQKLVEVSKDEKGFTSLRLTEKGRLRTLKYHLEDMSISPPKRWDGKWRLIIYDIAKFKRRQQAMFRRMLQKLKMLPLQRSVYLYPYPCDDEIEFLRQYFGVGENVIALTVSAIENETVYRRYFDI